MNFNLRNRISFYFVAVTALLIAILFFTIYFMVYGAVYRHLNSDLKLESIEIINSLVILDNRFVFTNPFGWNERKHGQAEVNPVFVQVTDTSGNILKKSGNLIEGSLFFNSSIKTAKYLNSQLSGSPIRQLQTPIKNPVGRTLGYMIIAMPLEEPALAIENLKMVLIVAYPFVLIFLFSISRYFAGKSILPINNVISTARKITRENLENRIELPPHKDEIYILTSTINDLLNRLEESLLHEEQFTSDASHELRTPLSVIKGTLEVLIRKPRTTREYISKIKYCIKEVDRISILVDQLLTLARYESGKTLPAFTKVNMNKLLENVFLRLQELIQENRMLINFEGDKIYHVKADEAMLEIIFENIVSNSIKYSKKYKNIDIIISEYNSSVICNIKDYGIGMSGDQIAVIFDRFYRVDEVRTAKIFGNGLGLAIVKKLADLQNIKLGVSSEPAKGTNFRVEIEKA